MNPSLDITFFYATFILYFCGFLTYASYAAFRWKTLHAVGAAFMALGLIFHTAALAARGLHSGHLPLTNMYEYLSITVWAGVLFMLFIMFTYRRPLIGSLMTPPVLMLTAATALLPKDINQSLMPALQSYWLDIHVSLAALGSGCFMLAFVAGLVYLLRRYRHEELSPRARKRIAYWGTSLLLGLPLSGTAAALIAGLTPPAPDSRLGPPGGGMNLGPLFILLGVGSVIGFLLTVALWPRVRGRDDSGAGGWLFSVVSTSLLIGALVEGIMLKSNWLVLTQNLAPNVSGGTARSAWLIFEAWGAAYLWGIPVFIIVAPPMARLSRLKRGATLLDLKMLDEMSYKSVSLGYPLYTIGALFAGAIWAEQAWGSFWSWDPKEVGALITWLLYTGYLHARLQRGWRGSRAAVLVVAGFLMFILSFFGNYFLGGLHTYV